MKEVRRGDTVIWLHGGQEGTDDGLPARVHKVYPGGSAVDLLVENFGGSTSTRSVVPHNSSRDEVSEARILSEGLWKHLEEHHEIYVAEEKDRLARLEKARKSKSKKQPALS